MKRLELTGAAVLAAALSIPAHGAPPLPPLGTLTVDKIPAYHQPVFFSWTLVKAIHYGSLGLFCNQPGGGWEYIAEYPVGGISGSASWILDNSTSSAVPGTLDYEQPANCTAYIYDEKLVRQGKPAVVTNQVFFTVAPAIGVG